MNKKMMYYIKDVIQHPARNKAQTFILGAVQHSHGYFLENQYSLIGFEIYLNDTCKKAHEKYPSTQKLQVCKTEKKFPNGGVEYRYDIRPDSTLPFCLVTLEVSSVIDEWKGDIL